MIIILEYVYLMFFKKWLIVLLHTVDKTHGRNPSILTEGNPAFALLLTVFISGCQGYRMARGF